MKAVILIFLTISLAWGNSLEVIEQEHNTRLNSIDLKELNLYEKLIAKTLRKYAGGALNDRLVNYLAVNEQFIFKFKKASELAKEHSLIVCKLSQWEESLKTFFRHTDDEVDAVRHLLWSGYLTYFLDTNTAFELTSLQEDRVNNPYKSMLMDLWNNYWAIKTIQMNKKDILSLAKARKTSICKKTNIKLF